MPVVLLLIEGLMIGLFLTALLWDAVTK